MTALLVVGVMILLVAADVVVVHLRKRRGGWAATEVVPMRTPRPPHALFLHPAHSWVCLHSDGTLRVGIDDFLADALGKIDEVQVPPPGTRVERGAPLITLRVGKRRMTVPAPAAGEVVGENALVSGAPRTVSSDPYGLGWVCSLETRDQKEAIGPLHVGSGAASFLHAELERLTDFLTMRHGAKTQGALLLADGGLPLRGAVGDLDDEGFGAFSRQFLAAGEAR
jgi:glycine cleavage system H protein